ncbi:MAG: endolytic transglycosylase MltG [Oscillospiraceae bacterium]|jgi:UPF0755 protein|nr:endolytic transglycosylase MltG [Oscillospiraceae bacterium]
MSRVKHILWIALLAMALLVSACQKNARTTDASAATLSAAESVASAATLSAAESVASATTLSAAESVASATTLSETVRVTLPEGVSFYEAAKLLEKNSVCTAKAFFDAAQNYEVKSFAVKNDPNRCYKFEGYLYPDTYEFYRGANAKAVLVEILNNYRAKSGLPSDETLILASMLEREARSAEHMAKVAAVLQNRLALGMKLQTDCTIHYVEKYIKPNPLVASPERFAPLYNTYKCAALPAGPINSPGKQALRAAQSPAQGMDGYLFYFFGNDNTNHYSKTYEEHEAQMKIYGVQY